MADQVSVNPGTPVNFIGFLDDVEQVVDPDLAIYGILGNSASRTSNTPRPGSTCSLDGSSTRPRRMPSRATRSSGSSRSCNAK